MSGEHAGPRDETGTLPADSDNQTADNRPYPTRWERHIVLENGWRIFARPIRPNDEPLVQHLLQNVSKDDLRLRFFDSIREFTHPFLASLTQLDYARAMAFIAFDEASGETLGMVRVYSDSNQEAGEYAILLKSGIHGRGLGWMLMQMIIEYSRSEGLNRVFGQVLQDNSAMLDMCRELGFEIKSDPEDSGVCDVTLVLGPSAAKG
ncbi:MAG: GNAT family N-acetyltransferase [Bradyrhizobium sp.]